MNQQNQPDRSAILHIDEWAGPSCQPCVVVGETPGRYIIRPIDGGTLRLPDRLGAVVLHGCATQLVSKTAITFPPSVSR